MERYNYQNYKDERDCLTKKVLNRAMYIILNDKKRPLVNSDGSLLIFYKARLAAEYLEKNRGQKNWKVKKVRLDITTL